MKYLNMFANCPLVKGKNMSLICDLQLRKYYHVPNDMADVLDYLKSHSVEECYDAYGYGNKGVIKSYVDFVLKNDMGFLDTRIMDELAPLPLQWDAYSDITNVIVELSQEIANDSCFIEELVNLNLEAIEIRCYEAISSEKLIQFLNHFSKSVVGSIRIFLKWDNWCTEKLFKHLIENNLRINSIVVHSSPQEKTIKLLKNSVSILYKKEVIASCLQCGVIDPGYFRTNIDLFTESQKHNTCLNRKLSINKDGYIKNCPSMPESFGHISQTRLADVLANPEFKKNWLLNKDRIAVCKDCEFRHVCTDCRAYVEQPQDRYSKPLKCGYDPYANVWEDWATSPLKQEAIVYYGLEK